LLPTEVVAGEKSPDRSPVSATGWTVDFGESSGPMPGAHFLQTHDDAEMTYA
jgi:hypothetical protein